MNELHAVELAFGSYLPLAIAVAARTAVAARRARHPAWAFELAADGRLHWAPLSYLRAFLLAALVELRRVTEVVLPGFRRSSPGRKVGRSCRGRAARRSSSRNRTATDAGTLH